MTPGTADLGQNFVGHDAAWREWRAALDSTRMHHGWILAGPKGMGKGAFARAAARAPRDRENAPGR